MHIHSVISTVIEPIVAHTVKLRAWFQLNVILH